MKCACLSLLCLLALLPVRADDKKKPADPKLVLGKDTTYVTGPLDKDGYIDYEAALNAELGRGITPEKNANALLIAAFGPAPEGGDGLPPAYFRWLDIPIPPKDGEYLLGLTTFARDQLALTDAQLEAVFEQQSRSSARPWSAKDHSVIAEWLKVNEKPLAVSAEALKRPAYFNPLCSRRKEGEPSNLIGSLLPSVQKCRELASAFTSRAMLRVHEGKFDDAWQDLLACHRLGRLTSHGATIIESLVGIAIGQIANNSTLAYVEHAKLTPKQAAERLKDLQRLPPLKPMADKIDLLERLSGLDALQNIRRFGKNSGYLIGELFGEDYKPSDEERKILEALDWTTIMRVMNKWYDRMAVAMRVADRQAREKEFDKIDEELLAVKKKAAEAGNLTKLLQGKDAPGEAAGTVIGEYLMALLMPAVRKVQMAHDRAEQSDRNLRVAFALAAYRADQGRYPAKLDDLAPDYLAAVPGDLFSGKPLIYKPEEKGYLFYSVGPNGKDEGGRWYDDDPPGDDPRVRMPLPPLKKP
jgi:hypothetical protein